MNENVRQQALPLFIEDAVQETTTTSSGVSAEYGRFAGGVVTMLTKSGGNQFSGSLRGGLSNPHWNSLRPGEATPTNKTTTLWEVTLGGFGWKDHLWFFVAGRDTGKAVTSRQTQLTNVPYDTVSQEKRYEGKLTFSITPEHRIVGSYNKIDQTTTGSPYTLALMDTRSLVNRKDPQKLWAVNYTGVLRTTSSSRGSTPSATTASASAAVPCTPTASSAPCCSTARGLTAAGGRRRSARRGFQAARKSFATTKTGWSRAPGS